MNYTPKHYEQDRKIATHIYKRYFNGHYLRDDLIQVAIAELWKLRKRGTYIDYMASACDIARKKMISFLRRETRHLHDYFSDPVADDLTLADEVACEQPTVETMCEHYSLCRKLLPDPTKVSNRDRAIISMHLKHYTQNEIARKTMVTQQYVSLVINKFRKTAREILDNY